MNYNSIRLGVYLACLFCLSQPLLAQSDSLSTISADTSLPVMDYELPQTYEIGGIKVEGCEYTDPNAVIAVSGLKVGESIKLPGDDIGKSIRKLWTQGLFVDVQILLERRLGEAVFLKVVVKEYPRFARHAYRGVRKGWQDDLNELLNRYLLKGRAATKSMKRSAVREIKDFLATKGYPDATVSVEEEEDIVLKNSIRWVFNVDRGKRIRIQDINFVGNEKVSDAKLRRLLKDTKRKRPIMGIFKPSKYIEYDYKADKENVMAYYNKIGLRDAKILRDSVYIVETPKKNGKVKKSIQIDIHIDEGTTYYFGDIKFRGNSSYSDEVLGRILGIRKGEVYNEELLQSRISFDRNGRDLSTLYMDNGYLFFQANPVEKGVKNDTVDIEIRIQEGPIATIDRVIIKGNDRTHEHVIRRELRTLPGAKFSRSDIMRSQRELMALNYFNPEAMGINTPVNPQRGTVDIEYTVEERPSDQLELSAGWGGYSNGLIGTLGVTFNNFSLRNLFKAEAWNPLPQGDGQRLSLRVQTNGRYFQSYNFSFTEPWLGGKKRNALSVSAYHSRYNNGQTPESSSFQQLLITGVTVGLGTRLRWPDDYFGYQIALEYQNMNLLRRYDFTIPTGIFNDLSIRQTLSRNSVNNPLFPESGSTISLSMKLTFPYSLVNGWDYTDTELPDTDRFRWVEYHKWDFESAWYTKIAKNLVIKTEAKLGFLGSYNKDVGLSPFGRYELGGDGISNFVGLQGKDIVSLRGYSDPVEDVSAANETGAAVYNKFTAELRYLLSPNPNATIYVLGFVQGGNAWSSFREYNPFMLKRSVGAGLRVFLPMFGTLGFDYGIGFDKDLPAGSSMFDYGSFNIVLGFEPK
ncbi:outer membrane protein assembly factor BamA [Saprospira sp. CCB-QB6]|uniref:outer membrane protein assembly factor BamA n=1 Tax=Saprospira sp. CCB-QB6 TaxID=3023936 RepID=UPI0023491F8F|nr:outer membrane protein assembly factor BamA [Saprospira sp. CCB-QB6]WCL81805.1 outer membrane protein assembly factor BamA [Saprospira sp. CCB-QB6]